MVRFLEPERELRLPDSFVQMRPRLVVAAWPCRSSRLVLRTWAFLSESQEWVEAGAVAISPEGLDGIVADERHVGQRHLVVAQGGIGVEPAGLPRLSPAEGAGAQPTQGGEVVDAAVSIGPLDLEFSSGSVGVDLVGVEEGPAMGSSVMVLPTVPHAAGRRLPGRSYAQKRDSVGFPSRPWARPWARSELWCSRAAGSRRPSGAVAASASWASSPGRGPDSTGA